MHHHPGGGGRGRVRGGEQSRPDLLGQGVGVDLVGRRGDEGVNLGGGWVGGWVRGGEVEVGDSPAHRQWSGSQRRLRAACGCGII